MASNRPLTPNSGGTGTEVSESGSPIIGDGGGEPRIVAALIAATLLVSSLPYLFAWFITPPGFKFIGTAYNIDDYCNYLSWLRQCADGHFFLHNLFTTDPQKGLEFNVFFSLLGGISHVTHLPPQAVLQLARVVGGAGLLALIYKFYRLCLPTNPEARLTAFGFACFSSGLGWVVAGRWADQNVTGISPDAWQPEAFTFLSLYVSALFTVSTLLIVGALYALLRGEQTGQWKYPIIAGLCTATLGNMHSYDVLHVAAAWGLYLVVWTIFRRGKGVGLSWARALLVLAMTLPTTGYEYYAIQAETVFRERAAVATLSPHFFYYIWGYGIVFALAIVGAILSRRTLSEPPPSLPLRKGEGPEQSPTPAPPLALRGRLGGGSLLLLPLCWAVAGFLVIYLPFAFQRKMLMGEHIPLCLLAGVGAAWLTQRIPGKPRGYVLAGLVALTFLSNGFFLKRDMTHLIENRSETQLAPFLSGTLTDTFAWIKANTQPKDAILGFPSLCTYLPGETGRAVWAGHWGETPHYGDKVNEFAHFARPDQTDEARRAFLAETHAQYLFYPNAVSGPRFADFAQQPPSYLVRVYANKDYTVFRIGL